MTLNSFMIRMVFLWSINAVKYERLDILQHLMKKPFININEVDKDNKTALYYAFYRDNPKILDYLLKNGADINTEGVTGQKILTEAIKQNNLDFVKYLTETKHVDINNVNEHNHTPIYTAVHKNNIEIVKYLATKGVDVNKQYKNGNTLTHKAIEQNNFEMVKCLADNGAKLNIPNNDGITPLQQMFITDKKDMINYLLNNHNEEVELVFKLRQAIENEDLNTVKYLVEEKGVDVNTAFYDKVTPVHKAVELGNMEIAKYLIEQGADINAKDKDNRGLDHYVAIGGNLELLKYLIEEKQFYTNKNNNSTKDKEGCTVIHYAAEKGNLEMVKYLMGNGLASAEPDNEHNAVVNYAAKSGNVDLLNRPIKHVKIIWFK